MQSSQRAMTLRLDNLDGCEEWGVCDDLESAKEYLARDPDADEDE